MTSSSIEQPKHSDVQYEQPHETSSNSKDNEQSNIDQEGNLNTDYEAQVVDEQEPNNEEENTHSIYEKENEGTKDFEPSCDTPRLKFKKPSDKPSKKKTAVAGTKRMAINTSMGILFGKDGITEKSAPISEETKETQIIKTEKEATKVEQNESDMRKRDLKDLTKNPIDIMRPIVK